MRASKLNAAEVRTRQFHILSKFHKPNIPGRPVVSSVECHTSKILRFFGHFLQSHAKSLSSYIKCTSGFITRINETKYIHEDTILVKLDVKSLYTNNTNHAVIEAVKSALNPVSQKTIATKVIIRILFLILTLNNFVLLSVSTMCVPNCTNIVMRKFKNMHLFIRKFSFKLLLMIYSF